MTAQKVGDEAIPTHEKVYKKLNVSGECQWKWNGAMLTRTTVWLERLYPAKGHLHEGGLSNKCGLHRS